MKRIIKVARTSIQYQEITVEIPDPLEGDTTSEIDEEFVKAAYDKAEDTDFSGSSVTDSYQIINMAMEDGTKLPPDTYQPRLY